MWNLASSRRPEPVDDVRTPVSKVTCTSTIGSCQRWRSMKNSIWSWLCVTGRNWFSTSTRIARPGLGNTHPGADHRALFELARQVWKRQLSGPSTTWSNLKVYFHFNRSTAMPSTRWQQEWHRKPLVRYAGRCCWKPKWVTSIQIRMMWWPQFFLSKWNKNKKILWLSLTLSIWDYCHYYN